MILEKVAKLYAGMFDNVRVYNVYGRLDIVYENDSYDIDVVINGEDAKIEFTSFDRDYDSCTGTVTELRDLVDEKDIDTRLVSMIKKLAVTRRDTHDEYWKITMETVFGGKLDIRTTSWNETVYHRLINLLEIADVGCVMGTPIYTAHEKLDKDFITIATYDLHTKTSDTMKDLVKCVLGLSNYIRQ